jgi:hypothetical protein
MHRVFHGICAFLYLWITARMGLDTTWLAGQATGLLLVGVGVSAHPCDFNATVDDGPDTPVPPLLVAVLGMWARPLWPAPPSILTPMSALSPPPHPAPSAPPAPARAPSPLRASHSIVHTLAPTATQLSVQLPQPLLQPPANFPHIGSTAAAAAPPAAAAARAAAVIAAGMKVTGLIPATGVRGA